MIIKIVLHHNRVSNALNSHIADIGPKLASQIPPSSRDFSEYINPTEHSFNISQISNNKLNELINALQNK